MDIIEKVSEEALLALTAAQAGFSFRPVVGNINQGLNVLNDLFGRILYSKLPSGQEWLEQLESLGAVQINSVDSTKDGLTTYLDFFPAYLDPGIKKDTETHTEAMEILKSNSLPKGLLVDHSLNPGYARIPVPARDKIDHLHIQKRVWQDGSEMLMPVRVSEDQVEVIESVYKLYAQDDNLKEKTINAYMEEWNHRPNLKVFREWWDDIPIAFSITSAGKELAHANAQERDKKLPAMN